MIIDITIKNKQAFLPVPAVIVCGNKDYKINFSFDEEWESRNVKTARFFYNGTYEEVVFEGNLCEVPVLSNTTGVYIGVFSGDVYTTTPAYIPCEKSILCFGGTHAEPPEDVYNQIIDLINKLQLEKGKPTDKLPLVDGEASAGQNMEYARADHIHPTDETRASVKALTEETERAKVAEEANATAITEEAARAKVAEGANAEAITEEAARAKVAEGANAEAIAEEVARAKVAEEANATAIAEEVARAKVAEEANATAIAEEVTRAKAAEEANATAIAEEVARAKIAEEANATAIAEETERAKATEKIINDTANSALDVANTSLEHSLNALNDVEKLEETKQDNIVFDGEYNAENNKAATVQTVINKVAEIVANAPEDFDTLKELADWLATHGTEAAKMNSDIKALAEAIAAEIERATKAEQANATAIAEEEARAKAAEEVNANAIEELSNNKSGLFIGTADQYKTSYANGEIAVGTIVVITDGVINDNTDNATTTAVLGEAILGQMILGEGA